MFRGKLLEEPWGAELPMKTEFCGVACLLVLFSWAWAATCLNDELSGVAWGYQDLPALAPQLDIVVPKPKRQCYGTRRFASCSLGNLCSRCSWWHLVGKHKARNCAAASQTSPYCRQRGLVLENEVLAKEATCVIPYNKQQVVLVLGCSHKREM